MNVLLVSFEYPPHTATGGIGSYMLHLTNLLLEDGHRVTVFSALPDGKETLQYHRENFSHYCILAIDNKQFRQKAAEFFEQFIKMHNVDVIESPEVGACAIEIKRKYPHIPLVVKMHTPGVLITKVSRYHQPLTLKLRFVLGALLRGRFDLGYWSKKDKTKERDEEYQICQMADRILSPSKALKTWAVSFWQLPGDKIAVVPNVFSADDKLFDFSIENRPRVISFVGKLTVLKGMINFTKAIPKILDRNPGYELWLIGRDEAENGVSMKAYMQNHLSAYCNRIFFKGVLSGQELKQVYAQSRLCIFPSLWENYPTVVLEAMAAGTPVAAANCGGIPEVIENGSTGVLFNPRKPRQIAQTVNKLLADDSKRLRLAHRARGALREQLKNEVFKHKILNTYKG